jgi:hypothetical protein
MNAAADHQHRFMTRDEGPRFVARQPSRISQSLIHAADLIEVSQVFWCADDCGDGSMAVGCRADVDELDSIGAGGDQAKVLFDAVGGGDLRIASHPESEIGFRTWRLGGDSWRNQNEPEPARQQKKSEPHEHSRAHGLLTWRRESRERRAEVGSRIVPELGDERVSLERRLNEAALNTAAPPVHEAHLAQPGLGSGVYVVCDDASDIPWGEGV